MLENQLDIVILNSLSTIDFGNFGFGGFSFLVLFSHFMTDFDK